MIPFLTDHVFTEDNLLHAAGGAGLALLWFMPPWLGIVLTTAVWAILREVGQNENQWLDTLKSPHKMLEAGAWVVGSLPVAYFIR